MRRGGGGFQVAERLLLRDQLAGGAGILGHEHRRGGAHRADQPVQQLPRLGPLVVGERQRRASGAWPRRPITSRSTTSPAASRLVANTRICDQAAMVGLGQRLGVERR